MLLWIVKKLKKFPFAYPVATLRDANWYVIATIAVAANPSRTMFNTTLQCGTTRDPKRLRPQFR